MPPSDHPKPLLDQLDVVVVPAEHPGAGVSGITLPGPITVTISTLPTVTIPR